MKFTIDETGVTCSWNERQKHHVPHEQFERLIRAIDQAPTPAPQSVIAATGFRGYAVFLAFRFLVATGCLSKVGKGKYRKHADFPAAALAAYLGCEADDVSDETTATS